MQAKGFVSWGKPWGKVSGAHTPGGLYCQVKAAELQDRTWPQMPQWFPAPPPPRGS